MFSPDGKMLAFTAGPRSDGTWDLTLVPATGGPERVVANYPRRRVLCLERRREITVCSAPRSIPRPPSSAYL